MVFTWRSFLIQRVVLLELFLSSERQPQNKLLLWLDTNDGHKPIRKLLNKCWNKYILYVFK